MHKFHFLLLTMRATKLSFKAENHMNRDNIDMVLIQQPRVQITFYLKCILSLFQQNSEILTLKYAKEASVRTHIHTARRCQELASLRCSQLLSQNVTNYGEVILVQDNKNSTSRLKSYYPPFHWLWESIFVNAESKQLERSSQALEPK